ncbi:MAG: phosphotransferase [Nocardioidaceae bacterium]
MVESTHDVVIGDREVVKRYRSWQRGEPDREWAGLSLLDRFAPGLAPRPVKQRVEDGVPVLVMSRLPGVALGSEQLSDRRLGAVAAALTQLHTVVPADVVASLPRRLWSPAEAVTHLRGSVQEQPSDVGSGVRRAFAAGSEWIGSPEATVFAEQEVPLVFAQADGNLANFIWDGSRCGLVDFEDSGASDRAFEIADLVEHVSAWLTGVLDAERLLEYLGLDAALSDRVRDARRVMALFWLVMLLPGNPGHHRNPVGSVDRQAERLLGLLDSAPAP